MNKYRKLLKDLDYVANEADNDLVQNLLKVPKADKAHESPHTTTLTPQYINQVDLLFLPTDYTKLKGDTQRAKSEFQKVNAQRKREKKEPFKKDGGYRYLVVAVDTATGKMDAEPIKYKYSFIVRDALKRIYARKILQVPHEIEVDAGGEFKDEFDSYFNSVSHVRHKKSGRHRAQAVVEGVNSLLSKLVQTRMLAQEINTGETSVEWVDEIPAIVNAINKYFVHDPPSVDPEKHTPIKCKKGSLSCDVLPEGTPVRIQLDNPVDSVKTKRLHGAFRIGDIRWENKIRHITQIFLRPNFPPMYKVDDIDVGYTRKQLQVVKTNEKQPSAKLQKKVIVEEILDRFKIKNKVFFKIKWSDGDITQESRTELIKDIPGLIEEFEDILKYNPKIVSAFKIKNKIYFKVKWKNGEVTEESRKEFMIKYPSVIEKFES